TARRLWNGRSRRGSSASGGQTGSEGGRQARHDQRCGSLSAENDKPQLLSPKEFASVCCRSGRALFLEPPRAHGSKRSTAAESPRSRAAARKRVWASCGPVDTLNYGFWWTAVDCD